MNLILNEIKDIICDAAVQLKGCTAVNFLFKFIGYT